MNTPLPPPSQPETFALKHQHHLFRYMAPPVILRGPKSFFFHMVFSAKTFLDFAFPRLPFFPGKHSICSPLESFLGCEKPRGWNCKINGIGDDGKWI